MLMHIAEMWSWWKFRFDTQTVEQCRAWRFRFILFAGAVGSMWGLRQCASSLRPGVPSANNLRGLGLSAGAVTMNPIYPPALYIYLASILLPTIFRVVYEDDAMHWILAAMLSLFTIVVLDQGGI